MRNVLMIFFGAVLLCSVPLVATAQTTSKIALTLKGSAFPAGQSDVGPDGQCNFNDWVSTCPSGNCQCFQISSPSGSGSIDKGKLSVSNFFVTIDQGVNPATEPAVPNGPNPRCSLFLAVLTITGNKGSRSLNGIGTACKQIGAISNKNHTAQSKANALAGGWGISDAPAPSPAQSGWGTLSGTVADNSNPNQPSALNLKLKGWLTH